MPRQNPGSRGRLRVPSLAFLLFGCVAACVAAAITTASADDQGTPAAAASAPSAGMKVNVDPATGRLLETPSPAPDTGAASPVAAELPPLEMAPSPVPGGGIGFRNPDKRFQAELKATTAPDGSAHVACEAPAK